MLKEAVKSFCIYFLKTQRWSWRFWGSKGRLGDLNLVLICLNSLTSSGRKVIEGMDAKRGGITLAPPEAAAVETASLRIKWGCSEMEVTSAVYLGRGIGILVTLEAFGGQGRTILRGTGQWDLPEASPEACFKPKREWVKKISLDLNKKKCRSGRTYIFELTFEH